MTEYIKIYHMPEISQNLKIVFMGTPEFGAVALKGLIDAGYKPVLVITKIGSLVEIIAQKYNIPVRHSMSNIDKPDMIIVAAYGHILQKEILEIPKYGCLNVHPSLLPKYRGPSPIQTAILSGDKETGVTIMKMDEKMDHGPILINYKLQITNYNYEKLHDELAKLGAKLLVKTIPDYITGKIKPLSQDESMATYTKILRKEDGRIDWKNPADCIERQVRALNPNPGVFALADNLPAGGHGKILKILKTSIQEQAKTGPVGTPGKTFLAANEKIAVQTGKNYLIIEELQLEGKKPVAAADFIRGHQNFIGIILE